MKVFKKEKRFHPKTGKPYEIMVHAETRCDFSGEVVWDCETEEKNYYCQFDLDYEDSDPCFGSGGDEYKFGEKNNIDVYIFLSQPYVIGDDKMSKFLKALLKYDTFDSALRTMRIATAQKLIDVGTIKAEQLSTDDE